MNKLLKRTDLHDYQKNAINFAKNNPKCGLFLDMGLGKTATSLTIAENFLNNFFVLKVLIIAPLRVANTVWQQESKKWEHLKDLKITVCTGTTSERKKALQENADIHVINRENVEWLVNNEKWRWDMLIIDESTSFKSPKSKRFKALKKVIKYTKSVLLLSGTPTPNGYLDLWTQIFLLDNGERLGKTITQYKSRFFRQSGYMGYNYELQEHAEKTIKSLLKDICITMQVKDYLNLPAKINVNEYITMPKQIKDKYKELEKSFFISLTDNSNIYAVNSGALANKLLQFCNGAVYDENKDTHEIHNEKIERLKEIIKDNENENFLIAYNYKSDLERLKKALPQAVELSKSGKELEKWNKGDIKILLAHPMSAGHGLNAQKGGSCVVWYGLNWSLELYQQFNARLHRQGQEKPVRIIHIVAKGGLDEKVLNALSNKAKTQNELIEFLKHRN